MGQKPTGRPRGRPKSKPNFKVPRLQAIRVYYEEHLLKNPEEFVTIGHRIKFLRVQAGLTTGDMASIMGIRRPTVCLWEGDYAEPSWHTVKVFSLVFEIPLDVLLDGVAPLVNGHRKSSLVALPRGHTTRPGYLKGVAR